MIHQWVKKKSEDWMIIHIIIGQRGFSLGDYMTLFDNWLWFTGRRLNLLKRVCVTGAAWMIRGLYTGLWSLHGGVCAAEENYTKQQENTKAAIFDSNINPLFGVLLLEPAKGGESRVNTKGKSVYPKHTLQSSLQWRSRGTTEGETGAW